MTEYGWNPDLHSMDFRFWPIKQKQYTYPLEISIEEEEEYIPISRFDLLDIPEE